MNLKLVSIVSAFVLVALIGCSGASEPSSQPTATVTDAATVVPPTEKPTATTVPIPLSTAEPEPTVTPVPTARPAATPTPRPATAPLSTPVPAEPSVLVEFKGSIPSINALVTDIRLFERGPIDTALDDHVYRTAFDRTATSLVYAELSLAYPTPRLGLISTWKQPSCAPTVLSSGHRPQVLTSTEIGLPAHTLEVGAGRTPVNGRRTPTRWKCRSEEIWSPAVSS